ncbi:MAG: class I SAM-dependent methyltransferase [Ignavibacteriae bacterium]|nr:class I SAM-dependent methyltransferase [Ignavibacteriota bacterium]
METLEKTNQLTRKAYNKAAQKYYDLFYDELGKKEFDKNIIDEYLSLFNEKSILCSVGCGPCGHIENYIYQKGINIVGIDISEKCIKIAKNKNPKIHFEIGDFSKLKFKQNYFDGIISYYSIIDTPKKYLQNVFKEFNRVLKKNGYLLIVTKEGNSEGYEEELLDIKSKIYYSLFSMEEIQSALESSGFKNERILNRKPYIDEIQINRIYSISKKVT